MDQPYEKITCVKCIGEREDGTKIIVRIGYGPESNTVILGSFQVGQLEIDLRTVCVERINPEIHSIVLPLERR